MSRQNFLQSAYKQFAERSQNELKKLVKPAYTKLYQDYKNLVDAQSQEKKQDKKNAMQEQIEAALKKYLDAIATDTAFPQDFRDEIKSALADDKRINDAIQALNK